MKRSAIAIFWSLSLIGQSRAQKAQPRVYSLIISCTCDDSVGKGYARALRDLIAKSPRYDELVDSKENRKQALVISVVTLPLGDDTYGSASGAAISVVFVFNGTFVNQYVQTCSESVTASCAQKTLDSVDSMLSQP